MRKVCVFLAFCLVAMFVFGDVYAQVKQPQEWAQPKRLTVKGQAEVIGPLKLRPTDTPPVNPVEGQIYWDDSENAQKNYNGSAWIALTATTVGTGDNTLDLAYDQGGSGAGRAIVVDSGAITMTVSNTSNNVVLAITQSDTTNNPAALTITNSGTGNDITGTSGFFAVASTGVVTALSIVLENTGTIKNDTNNEIEFGDNSEDVSMVFTSNTMTWATDSSVATMGFGEVDALIGIGSIAFDQTASSISLASNGDADDLTLQVTGANNVSLVLASSGTAADAMTLTTTAGGIDILNGGAAGGEDIDVTSTNASINLTAGESAVDSIVITSSIGGIDILAAGAAPGEDIDIVATGSSINITATEGIETAIVLNASTVAGGIDITSQADIDITTTGEAGEDITLTNTGGSINLSATEDIATAIVINSTTGGIDITADGAAASDLDMVCTNGSVNVTAGESAADSIVISSSNGGIDITAASASAGEDIDILATGSSINITATEADAAAIVLNASTALGGIDITSNADIDITTTGEAGEDITLTNTGGSINLSATEDIATAIVINATTGGIDITADGATGSDLDLTCTNGSITITPGEAVADSFSLQASGGLDIDAVDDINIAVASTAGADDFKIIQTGAVDASILLEAAGTGADAIGLTASAGGIALTAVDDMILTVASTTTADDLSLVQTGAEDAGILLTAAGTGADAIGLTASAGGITLTANSVITMASNIERASGTTEKLNSDFQTEIQSVTFDVEEATMDADDGTGIKIASITLNFNAYVVQAFVNFSQGHGDAGDTCELIVNNADDISSPVTVLDAAQDQSAGEGLLWYAAGGSTTVPIAQTTATNQYVVIGYKDVGNDGSTSANLQGTLVVEYIRF